MDEDDPHSFTFRSPSDGSQACQLLHSFAGFYRNQEFTDLNILFTEDKDKVPGVDGERVVLDSFRCHKAVLATYSPFLHAWFTDPEKPGYDRVIMDSEKISPVHFRQVLEFMYCGEVTVPREEFEGLRDCAGKLKVELLLKEMERQMRGVVNCTRALNLVDVKMEVEEEEEGVLVGEERSVVTPKEPRIFGDLPPNVEFVEAENLDLRYPSSGSRLLPIASKGPSSVSNESPSPPQARLPPKIISPPVQQQSKNPVASSSVPSPPPRKGRPKMKPPVIKKPPTGTLPLSKVITKIISTEAQNLLLMGLRKQKFLEGLQLKPVPPKSPSPRQFTQPLPPFSTLLQSHLAINSPHITVSPMSPPSSSPPSIVNQFPVLRSPDITITVSSSPSSSNKNPVPSSLPPKPPKDEGIPVPAKIPRLQPKVGDSSASSSGRTSSSSSPKSYSGKKTYKNYSEETLKTAMDDVMSKKMSTLQAGKFYQVPSRTLYERLKRLGYSSGVVTKRKG